MKVVLIGSGNVGTVLGKCIKTAGHQVLQVYSRNPIHAATLARELDCEPISEWSDINPEADIYVIALSDNVIGEAALMIVHHRGLILHTAGSVSIEVLSGSSLNYGVLYPLQSLSSQKAAHPVIPFLVDGNSTESRRMAFDFGYSISRSVTEAGDKSRLKLHLAAVVVNNFTNHLFRLAAEFCEKEGVDFDLLKPLIRETANRIESNDPRKVQTGPAARHDEITIRKHIELLEVHPGLEEVYEVMTRNIMNWKK